MKLLKMSGSTGRVSFMQFPNLVEGRCDCYWVAELPAYFVDIRSAPLYLL